MIKIAAAIVTAALMSTPATRAFEQQLDAFTTALDSLSVQVAAGHTREAQLAFRRARTAYKRAEGLLAYFAPDIVVRIQGPLEESDDTPSRPFNTPGDFPSVESAVFPHLADSDRVPTLGRIRAVRERVSVLRSLTGTLEISESALFDAARTEIARVSTLDIAGFDSDRQDDALLDAAAALDGVRDMLATVGEPNAADSAIQAAADYLRHHSAFEQMDRFAFVTRYSIPASRAVASLRAARGVAPEWRPDLWRTAAASVYDSGAFDPQGYAGRFRLEPAVRNAVVALGERLFMDARLSGPSVRSCAGCHLPMRAFTDGLAKRASLTPEIPRPADAPPPRHTPTLLNAALQPAEFDDERVHTLEQQVAAVLADPNEMRSGVDTAVRRVAADSSYRAAFAAAFGGAPAQAVTPLALRVAIASYIRSLTAMNSPFDRAVHGDTTAISAGARRGFTVFMGKGRCGTCHFAPLFNGTQPPTYRSSDPEIIGVPGAVALTHGAIDPDPGRGGIDGVNAHRFAFKVPTVRNSAVTAPYMHNGVYTTLEQVVDFYDAGGGVGIGIDLPYQTLFDQPLHLTADEKSDVIAFLRSLTDTVPARDRY